MKIMALLTLTFAVQFTAMGQTQYQSGEDQIGLLELYTSEGCNSCPPADRWLSSMTEDDAIWSQFIPVAFHVDYWDYIGWKDRFASAEYSQRQRAHAGTLGMRTVYTPGFFYNGQEWRNWFIRKLASFPKGGKPGVLSLTVEDAAAQVVFAANEKTLRAPTVSVALLGFGLSTRVKAGENHGKTLKHDFVVLGVSEAQLTSSNDGYQGNIQLPSTDVDAPRLGIVAWVSERGQPTPLQAVGGWFDDS
ncbi:MAG: DUF1223 domain-containing protein [Pseudomonadota bacterium]